LFKDREIVVLNKELGRKSEILMGAGMYGSEKLAMAFNAIRNCKELLGRMFEPVEGISEFGVYKVKIYQENMWKCVIIDDKIPVTQTPSLSSSPSKLRLPLPKTSISSPTHYFPLFLTLHPTSLSSPI